MIRRLLAEDHALYREVRLRALAMDPHVFSCNLAREASLPAEHWRSRLQDEGVGIFGVFEGEAIVGMTGVAVRFDDPTCAFLWGTWTHADERTWPDGTIDDEVHYTLDLCAV